MAARFAIERATAVLADLKVIGTTAVSDQIGSKTIDLDGVSPESAETTAAVLVETFGELDILVKNAGIESAQALVHEAALENWKSELNVNLSGLFHCMNLVLPR